MRSKLCCITWLLVVGCGEGARAPGGSAGASGTNVVAGSGGTSVVVGGAGSGGAPGQTMAGTASSGASTGGDATAGEASGGASTEPRRPNVVFILIDDLGYGDLSAYGNPDLQTPNIDRVASEGTRFTQFYVGSPICSPSRVAFTTGQVPGRYRVHAEFSDHASNLERQMPDYLPATAPSVARQFQAAGYATAHVGKWHQGGGRDVGDAPLPSAYGFDESLTSFEGLGDRVLITGHDLSQQSAALGQGNITWTMKRNLTEIYVDRAIDFVGRQQAAPFFLHLWLDDVHDPFDPKPELLEKYAAFAADKYIQQYFAVADELDRNIGRLLTKLDELDLTDDTIVVISSDNGPTAWPRYYNEGETPPGITAGLRGRKWSLYEGGIREPLIVRWPGRVPAGKVNEQTVLHATDYLPTITALAQVPPPAEAADGEDFSDVMLGADRNRASAIFWEYGYFGTLKPGLAADRSPPLAIRQGDWKLLMRWDGSGSQLYNLMSDRAESTNLLASQPAMATQLQSALAAWRDSIWP